MANTETSICNRALAHIGTRSQIASLDEASPEAKVCKLVYEPTRDEVLSMSYWNFANKTATLSVLKAAPGTPEYSGPTTVTAWNNTFPPPGWLYAYAYPSDCIQMSKIIPQIDSGFAAGAIPIFGSSQSFYPTMTSKVPGIVFKAATDTDSNGSQINVILTNQTQAIAVYTMQVINPALFASQFVEALAFAVAAKIALQLTGDKGLMKAMYDAANLKIVEARQSDGNEGLTIIDQQASWITARDDFYSGGMVSFQAPYSSLFPSL